MRITLVILALISSASAQSLDEEYKKLFPNGAIVLQIRPEIEGANRIILKSIRLENQWSPDLAKRFIFYEAYLASKRKGKLTIKKSFEGREYAVFGSRVFLSEKRGSEFYVKYIISSDLRIVSQRSMAFLSLSRLENMPAELLVPPFRSCSSSL